ncbi:MAG: glycosyltransferase family 4 protein [Nitrososphaeria archaeon]
MKILFLSELFYPHGGGAELATYLYAKLLSERNFRVAVITNRFDGEPKVSKNGNVTLYRLRLFDMGESAKYSTLFRTDILFSSFIRKMINWADVVYVPRFWYSAIPLAKAYKKPVVVHLHDYISICPLSNFFNVAKDSACDRKGFFCSQKCIYLYEKLNNRSFRGIIESMFFNQTVGHLLGRVIGLSDAVICVSNVQKNFLLKNGNLLPSKTYVVYNPLPEVPENNLEVLGDNFGYFGGPSYLKGFHVLCKAAAFARRVKPITIYATKFQDVKNISLFKRFGIIAYGKLDLIDLKGIYKRIKAVLVPSIWEETWGYVVSEALLKGKIVIASRVGGIPEQVAGCEGAFLIEPGDHKALAENILHVSGLSKSRVIELGMKNRELIMKKFDNEITTRKFVSILERVMN